MSQSTTSLQTIMKTPEGNPGQSTTLQEAMSLLLSLAEQEVLGESEQLQLEQLKADLNRRIESTRLADAADSRLAEEADMIKSSENQKTVGIVYQAIGEVICDANNQFQVLLTGDDLNRNELAGLMEWHNQQLKNRGQLVGLNQQLTAVDYESTEGVVAKLDCSIAMQTVGHVMIQPVPEHIQRALAAK